MADEAQVPFVIVLPERFFTAFMMTISVSDAGYIFVTRECWGFVGFAVLVEDFWVTFL